MMKREALPVQDSTVALAMLEPESKPGPERAVFFNPYPRVVHVDENGLIYGFAPGHNYCTDPNLSEKLKAVAAKYEIRVL